LLGYGTWAVVEARSSAGLSESHLEIAWFGVHRDYQSREADTGHLCADRVYSTVLADARSSTADGEIMPVTLVCEVGNDRGRRFWQRCGFEDLDDLAEEPPSGQRKRYQRMLLGPRREGESRQTTP